MKNYQNIIFFKNLLGIKIFLKNNKIIRLSKNWIDTGGI